MEISISTLEQIWNPEFIGFSTIPDVKSRYWRAGDFCLFRVTPIKNGKSNSTKFEFTLPFVSMEDVIIKPIRAIDNGVIIYDAEIHINENTNIARVLNPKTWTASGEKTVEVIECRYKIK